MPAELLIVFVKRPRPGEVKTRLAQNVGADDASAVYRAMAEHVLRETAARAAGEYGRLVRFTPASAREEIERWLPSEPCAPQAGDDLGERMAHAFAQAFADGTRRVVLIGTDTPALERGHVLQAFQALRTHDLVIGPARDGGYYLVGLAAPRPELFRGIAWSTPSVCAATLARAAAHGLRTHALPELCDVDTLADLRHEWKRLAPLLEGREALCRRVESAR